MRFILHRVNVECHGEEKRGGTWSWPCRACDLFPLPHIESNVKSMQARQEFLNLSFVLAGQYFAFTLPFLSSHLSFTRLVALRGSSVPRLFLDRFYHLSDFTFQPASHHSSSSCIYHFQYWNSKQLLKPISNAAFRRCRSLRGFEGSGQHCLSSAAFAHPKSLFVVPVASLL